MKIRIVNQLLALAALVGILAACTGTQAPATSTGTSTPAATESATAVESTATIAPEAAPETATESPLEEPTEEPAEEQPSEEQASAAERMATERVTVEPLPPEECAAIQMAVAEKLGVEFQVREMEFDSEIANRQGTACTIIAMGTGEDFGNFLDVAQALRDILEAEGWSENPAYLADGPTGTAFAYEKKDEKKDEKEDQFAMVHVDWTPAVDAECPEDQPISACELEPSQQIFTVMLQLMQAS